MTEFLDSRKRSREDDSTSCESTPLSKRINKLHINYEDFIWNDNSSSSSCSTLTPFCNETTLANGNTNSSTSNSCSNNNGNGNNSCNNSNNNNNKHAHIVINGSGVGALGAQATATGIEADLACDQTIKLEYNPELTQEDNPFYYMKNKLLHDLHLQRLKRASH